MKIIFTFLIKEWAGRPTGICICGRKSRRAGLECWPHLLPAFGRSHPLSRSVASFVVTGQCMRVHERAELRCNLYQGDFQPQRAMWIRVYNY